MSNNTILKALERMGYKGKTTGHGFRATATTTIVQNLGYRYDVVDRQLSHAKGDKIRAAYDRAEFWEERVGMMQKWSDYLDRQAGKRPMLLHLRRFQDEQSARMAS
jgi:integrase